MRNRNALIERKVFVNTVGIKCADLDYEYLFEILTAFPGTLMKGKPADRHVLFGMDFREIKMTSDWLGCVLVIFRDIAKVFGESVT